MHKVGQGARGREGVGIGSFDLPQGGDPIHMTPKEDFQRDGGNLFCLIFLP